MSLRVHVCLYVCVCACEREGETERERERARAVDEQSRWLVLHAGPNSSRFLLARYIRFPSSSQLICGSGKQRSRERREAHTPTHMLAERERARGREGEREGGESEGEKTTLSSLALSTVKSLLNMFPPSSSSYIATFTLICLSAFHISTSRHHKRVME